MLIKLRNKFLFLMFGLTSAGLITAFLAVYAISYFKTASEINDKLNFHEELEVMAAGSVALGSEKTDAVIINRIFPDRGIYFNLLTNEEGKVLVIDSALKLPLEDYELAARRAWKEHKNETVKIGGRLWQYKITPASALLILDNESVSNGETYQIRFVDVTEAKKSLIILRNTLLLMGSVLLAAFYIMSVYFSNRAIKPMKETWENQQRFIADASHELKTPLSIISANLDVLYANKDETIASQLKWIDYASKGVKRMSGLVQSMLALSKAETENTLLNKSAVNIGNILNNTVSLFQITADDKNITIERHIPAEVTAFTYPALIEQCIHILIDNAVRYTPRNGTINILLDKTKSIVLLKIENSGRGISEYDLPKIFDRFFRSDTSRTDGGHGLGLSIAKTGIEKLGGSIEVISIENKKTIFTVKIPV